MLSSLRTRSRAAVALLAAAAATAVMAAPSPLALTPGAQGVIVSPSPVFNSPRIENGRVYAIAEVGNRIVVGGTFTSVRDFNSDVLMTRHRILAFDKVTGLIDPAFIPNLDGDVNALVGAPNGQSVYVGGAFKTVNGVTRKNLVRLSLANGTTDPTFGAKADKAVNDMVLAGNALIVGGRFAKIGATPRSLLAAVDATTGAVLGSLNVPLTVSRNEFVPFVQELDVSPDGTRLAAVGNFVYAGGVRREQMVMIDLTVTPAVVVDWTTNRFSRPCADAFSDTYLRDVAFSPDSSYVVTVTTGAFRAHTLCDSAERWEVARTGDVTPTWVTLTGGDTHWHATVTDAAVYVGGHQRWENNPNPTPGGDNDGPGAVSRQGIAALDPASGVPLSWNPGRHRGRGVEAFLATAEHLYVGSDTTTFGGVVRQRLAVLPVAGGKPNPPPAAVPLPVEVYAARTDGRLYRSSFDGTALSASTAVSGPGIDAENWSSLRDGWLQHGHLFFYGTAGAYYVRDFDGSTFGAVTNLSTSVGYVDSNYTLTPYDQPYNVDTTRAIAYHDGRLYYTRTNDTRLFWRGFSLESGIVGSQEYLASPANWSGATGLEIAGNWLYATWTDNRLYRAYVSGGRVDASRVLVDDGAVSGNAWATVRALVFRSVPGTAVEPAAPAAPTPLTCPAGQWLAEYYQGTMLLGTPALERCELGINYNYGTGAPLGAGLAPDQLSVRWTSTQTLSTAGLYQFTARTDDGVAVFVDGTPVIMSWRNQAATTLTGDITLGAGPHTIQMEYLESTGSASATLSYARIG